MVDFDEVFAYKTPKMVKILDRKLGMLFNAINIAVLLYIIVFVFYVNKAYLESELALGQVKIMVNGRGTLVPTDGSNNVEFDKHDLRNPAIENGAIFIITKVEAVKQTRGSCANIDFKCSSTNDCPLYPGVSDQSCQGGYCTMQGWCPPVGTTPDTKTWLLNAKTANITVWFRTAIQFPKLEPGRVFTNMDNPVPVTEGDPGETDSWYLNDLLASVGETLDNVVETGAMINARLFWDCDITTGIGCQFPTIFAKRLDSGSGYRYNKAQYVRSLDMRPERDTRILFRYSGVRILVASKGEGKKFSMFFTVLQFSSALALLSVSKIATDSLMKFALPEKRHYKDFKEMVTPDFSDIRDKLAEVKAKKNVS